MAKHWTKLKSDVVRSERMAALLDRSPLAYALYMNAKAVCDHFGRLPGTPVKFAGVACPMSRGVSIDEVTTALADMAAVRSEDGEPLVRFYTVGADKYLEIVGYNDIDDTEWRNVGQPEYPHPEDWQPPASLILFIAEATDGPGEKKSRIKPERYGISQADFARYLVECRPTVARPSPDSPASIAGASKTKAESDTESKAVTSNEDDPPPAPDFCGESLDPVIQAARAYFTQPNPPLLPMNKALEYGRACRAQLQGNSDFTDEQICEAFRTNGPRSGNERTFCGNWFERLRRERDGPANRASARTATLNQPASREAIARQAAAIGMGTETGDASDPLA